MRYSVAIAALMLTSACSSIVDGTSQEIMVNTNPPGARCDLEREGVVIASINPTPASTTIKKTKHDIVISCTKEGYEKSTFFNKSGSAAATFGNIVLGGGVGWAIDSASGADNKYDSPVNLTLNPIGALNATPAPEENTKIQTPNTPNTEAQTSGSEVSKPEEKPRSKSNFFTKFDSPEAQK
jgi:hypothetical protein